MLYSWFVQGGPWMWPILGLSVLGLMIVLERSFYWLRYAWVSDPIRRRAILLRRETAGRERDPIARIAALEPLTARMEADRLLRAARRGVGALEVFASLSTSLGLFGTVVGVSLSFQAISSGNSGSVVYGLGVALFTTVLGLVVHLYCAVFASFFTFLADRFESGVEAALRRTP